MESTAAPAVLYMFCYRHMYTVQYVHCRDEEESKEERSGEGRQGKKTLSVVAALAHVGVSLSFSLFLHCLPPPWPPSLPPSLDLTNERVCLCISLPRPLILPATTWRGGRTEREEGRKMRLRWWVAFFFFANPALVGRGQKSELLWACAKKNFPVHKVEDAPGGIMDQEGGSGWKESVIKSA